VLAGTVFVVLTSESLPGARPGLADRRHCHRPVRRCAHTLAAMVCLAGLSRSLGSSDAVRPARGISQYLALAVGYWGAGHLPGRGRRLADDRLRLSHTPHAFLGTLAAAGRPYLYRGVRLSGFAAPDRPHPDRHARAVGL